jgi:hypothetical protein
MKKLTEEELPRDYKNDLKLVRDAGFNPIAITCFACEISFCFKTEKETEEAYQKLQVSDESVDGWWYNEEKFLKYIKKEEDKFGEMVVWWLN